MKSFLLKISSPDGDVFCGDALKLSVRGTEGDLAVMAGHIPFVTCIKPCDCTIQLADETEKIGEIQGGLLTVSKEKVILLCGSFAWK